MLTADHLASSLEWTITGNHRRAHTLSHRPENDTTCAFVTYQMSAKMFHRGPGSVPLPDVTLSHARMATCKAKAMRDKGKRLPCCRMHLAAWLRMAPVDALTRGLQPFRIWSATWCTAPTAYMQFSTSAGSPEGAFVENDQLDVVVDFLLARGYLNDDVAWLLRRNAWRWSRKRVDNGVLPLDADARACAALVVAIYRGGAEAQSAVDQAVVHPELWNVVNCLHPLVWECDYQVLRTLLDRTTIQPGWEWPRERLAAELVRRELEGNQAA